MGKKKADQQDFLTRSMRKEKRGTAAPISEELNKHLTDNVLRKKAKLINREYKTKRILIKMSVIIVTFFLLTYGALAISKKIGGNFEVNLNNSNKLITMCEHVDFEKPTDILSATIPESMNNMSYTYLPIQDITQTDGAFNQKTDNFMGYTFYMKNVGNKALDYNMTLNILNFEKGLEEIIRFIIIRDVGNTGENVEYYYLAKAKADGTPELVYYYDLHARFDEEIETIPFVSDTIAYEKLFTDFRPGEIDKYSIIAWVEGSDEQTTNDKMSGIIKMNLQFDVIDNGGDGND